jgi:hydrogenase nickel incorporation protein HypA/HybF
VFICKGNCKTKFRLSIGDTLLRYNNGQKRCNICDVYFKWNGAKCPCCNAILHQNVLVAMQSYTLDRDIQKLRKNITKMRE